MILILLNTLCHIVLFHLYDEKIANHVGFKWSDDLIRFLYLIPVEIYTD